MSTRTSSPPCSRATPTSVSRISSIPLIRTRLTRWAASSRGKVSPSGNATCPRCSGVITWHHRSHCTGGSAEHTGATSVATVDDAVCAHGRLRPAQQLRSAFVMCHSSWTEHLGHVYQYDRADCQHADGVDVVQSLRRRLRRTSRFRCGRHGRHLFPRARVSWPRYGAGMT
jgi:hypothetical protein